MSRFQIALAPVTPFQQNCSVLWDAGTRRAAVVDPGGEAEALLRGIAGQGLVVEKILLTHGHLDHAGAATPLKQALDAIAAEAGRAPVPIIGPDQRDRFLLEGIEAQARAYGLEGMRNVVPDQWLREGDVVELGALRLDVLHCPGHTPGHVVFVEQAERFAIVGDVLFRGSVGRFDFPYGDGEALRRGILEKLLPLGDDIAFVCGHGPGSSFGAERVGNPFLQG